LTVKRAESEERAVPVEAEKDPADVASNVSKLQTSDQAEGPVRPTANARRETGAKGQKMSETTEADGKKPGETTSSEMHAARLGRLETQPESEQTDSETERLKYVFRRRADEMFEVGIVAHGEEPVFLGGLRGLDDIHWMLQHPNEGLPSALVESPDCSEREDVDACQESIMDLMKEVAELQAEEDNADTDLRGLTARQKREEREQQLALLKKHYSTIARHGRPRVRETAQERNARTAFTGRFNRAVEGIERTETPCARRLAKHLRDHFKPAGKPPRYTPVDLPHWDL
jgi:hypothetical protein